MSSKIPTAMVLNSALLLMTVIQSGCYVRFQTNAVQGSGVVETQTRQIDNFHSVKFSGVGNVEVEIGPEPLVEVTFDNNLLDLVETVVADGSLSISTSQNFHSKFPLQVKVVTQELDKVSLAGVGAMHLSGLDSDEIEVVVSGVGSLSASGQVRHLSLKLSGTGKANLEDLVATNVSVSVSGVGNARVHALESVDAKTSGVGGITIYGNPPNVNSSSSGVGKIKMAE